MVDNSRVQRVVESLSHLFQAKKEPSKFMNLLYSLSSQPIGTSPEWKMLTRMLGSEAFDIYVTQLVSFADEHAKTNQEDYEKNIRKIENNSLIEMDQNMLADPFIRLWSMVDPGWQKEVFIFFHQEPECMNSDNFAVIPVPKKHHPRSTSPIPSSAKYSAYAPCGKEFPDRITTKNCIDNGAGFIGAASGAFSGFTLGSMTVVGGVIGAIIGAAATGYTAHNVSSKITSKAMNIPEDRNLAWAYYILTLRPKAEDSVVKSVYQRLRKENEPRNGQTNEYYDQLQKAYLIVSEDRKKRQEKAKEELYEPY